mmetsp:Transcript_31463/g.76086  ORF Transcript_31463/g.76086 Transcript_31463/m.76086 type:complete len:714 (+) Transcript_31463:170-2311(+)
MVSYAGAARRLILLTALACASSSSKSFVAAASDPSGSGWRGDLGWTELESELSPSASLIDTSVENYIEECLPEFSEESPTNHALINQEHGLCLPLKITAWDLNQMNMTKFVIWPYDFSNVEPVYNLPSKVLFPSVASDVIRAVQFAEKHNLEISIKNSGHSFQGASSKRDTLHLNMNRYTHYAPDGIMDCDPALSGTTVADELSNQACLLALARNKPGLIRVGGGENFDKVYRAVIAANKALDKYKYHLVGGAAGTVSPMGWTWQGGNAGTMGGRRYGMGVDQVLQVEMVLPNGQHVKFGPTEWEDASAEGFVVPRTKVVSGVCRSNPDEQDEEKWIWGACPKDFGIDFGDLWFAVSGGGGGTWGVVTSVSLQLHDYLPYNKYDFSSQEECLAFSPKFQDFQARYFMAPSLLNVTTERSLACAAPNGVFEFYMHCYGEEDVIQAWTNFLELNNSTEAVSCLFHTVDASSDESPMSYPESVLMDENSRFPGKVLDPGGPSLLESPPGLANVLVPQSWIDESEENIDILLNVQMGVTPYYAYGVATSSFSDQANSLPQSLRDAATMSLNLIFSDNFWSDLFPKMYDISDKAKFPAILQSNHAGPGAAGPLKDDWTKPCPREWSFAERKEKCISTQEAIYGTEVLSRLEAIKLAVDPGFMFNCHGCIGNNLDLAKAPEVPPDEPAANQPSGASFVSTYAAAIVASVSVLHLFLTLS